MNVTTKMGAALLAALAVVLSLNPADAQHRRRAEPKPAAVAPTDATAADQAAATAAAALMTSQPLNVDLVPGELGWIKQCPNADAPEDCTIDGSFVIRPGMLATLKFRAALTPGATHPITIGLPLDLLLQPGFALTLGGTEAFIGRYTMCGAPGCLGSVVLDDSSFKALLAADQIKVIVSNAQNRSVMLTAPLAGMKEAIAGKAMSQEDVAKATEGALQRTIALAEQRAKERDAASNPPAGGGPSAAATPDGEASPPSAKASSTDSSSKP